MIKTNYGETTLEYEDEDDLIGDIGSIAYFTAIVFKRKGWSTEDIKKCVQESIEDAMRSE